VEQFKEKILNLVHICIRLQILFIKLKKNSICFLLFCGQTLPDKT